MDKKKITIIVSVIVVAIILALLILFGIKKEVTFDTVGGSEVATQKVSLFGKATKPENPTREGYTFDNWYLDDKIFDFNTSITKNVNLVARWVETGTGRFSISFNSNGGNSITPVKTDENGKISKPADPEREGYKFVAWQYEGKDFNFNTVITKNITLTAKWEKADTQVADTSFKITSGNLTLTVGNTKKLTTQNGSGKITWSSSNAKVASVDANGNVLALAAGTVKITAKSGTETSTITVTVKAKSSLPTTPTTPTKPEEPTTPVDPVTPVEPVITYSIQWVPVAGSAAGEEMLYILGTDGNHYAGTVSITTVSGKTQNVNVPISGIKYVRSAITNASFVSLN